jgi:hypothetical protein
MRPPFQIMQQHDLAFHRTEHRHSLQQAKTEGQRVRGGPIVCGLGGRLSSHVAQAAAAAPVDRLIADDLEQPTAKLPRVSQCVDPFERHD